MNFDETKNFIKVDALFIDDDTLIESLILSAETIIKEKTGKTFADTPELYKLAVNLMVKHWYDNRDSISEKSLVEVPFTISALIQHLALCENY